MPSAAEIWCVVGGVITRVGMSEKGEMASQAISLFRLEVRAAWRGLGRMQNRHEASARGEAQAARPQHASRKRADAVTRRFAIPGVGEANLLRPHSASTLGRIVRGRATITEL